MLNQMYYNVKSRLSMRLIALAVTILGCVFFLLLPSGHTVSGDDSLSASMVGSTLGVIFSSFAFIGIIIVCILASESNGKLLLKPPNNYLMVLTPVPAWKKLLGYIIPSAAMDIISIGTSILFIVIMSFNAYGGTSIGEILRGDWLNRYSIFVFAFLVVGYGLLSAAGVLWYAIGNTLFRHVPLRRIMTTIAIVALLFAFSWFSIVMLPFGELHRFGPIFAITISQPAVWHLVLMLLLLFVQSAVLFAWAAYLMDRRS